MSPELPAWLNALWRPDRLPSATRSLVRELSTNEGHATLWVLVVSLLLAWMLARWLSRRGVSPLRHPRIAEWFDRLAWPVMALVLVAVVHAFSLPDLSDRVLELGITLFIAQVFIQALLLLSSPTCSPASHCPSALLRTLSNVPLLLLVVPAARLPPLQLVAFDAIAPHAG